MSNCMRSVYQMAAKAGARYLDREASVEHPEIVPADWYNVIDLSILNMECPSCCVLSQLGQASRRSLLTFRSVTLALGMDPKVTTPFDEVVLRGFELAFLDPTGYRELTRAWTHEILDRRALVLREQVELMVA